MSKRLEEQAEETRRVILEARRVILGAKIDELTKAVFATTRVISGVPTKVKKEANGQLVCSAPYWLNDEELIAVARKLKENKE